MRTTIDEALQDLAADIGAHDPIEIAGSGTHGDVGGKVDAGARVVQPPAGILSYEPAEMTVTVRAGTPVAELHSALGEMGQITALPDGGTVGGALATGYDSLAALGRGQSRHALLQVRYISAEGKVITGGAPVVKNVSGFDLPRLLVGSLGTLGVIGEVVLRTNPLPSVRRLLRSSGVDPFAVLNSVRKPQFVLWDGSTTWIELGGHEPTVAAEMQTLAALGDWHETDSLPSLPEQRWSLPPSELRRLDPSASAGDLDTGPFVASIGVGTVFATRAQPPRSVSPALRELCERTKEIFDPTGRLNPGRSVLAGMN